VLVYPEGVLYSGVGVADVAEIYDTHLVGDTPVARLRAPAEVWG
jgi:(2Fe-2S) ferredoxin